jgi:hypothetical protein
MKERKHAEGAHPEAGAGQEITSGTAGEGGVVHGGFAWCQLKPKTCRFKRGEQDKKYEWSSVWAQRSRGLFGEK